MKTAPGYALRTMARRLLVPLLLAAPIVLGGATLALVAPAPLDEREALAKQSLESLYTYDQTWNTALRLVRVDLGYKVLEKDDKAGFILFEYTDKDSVSNGSIELVKTEKSIHVVCVIPKYPSYHEAVILDRLARKLKDEYGPPPDKPKPPPDAGPPPDDAGPDGGEPAP